jgi:Na+/H+-dicarboxylate symporter
MQPRGVLDIPDAAVVLIAQTTRTPLSLGDVLPVLGVSLITSEGARTTCRGSAIAIPVATLNVPPSASCWRSRSTGSSGWHAHPAI